jgi:hypothetical protein
MIDPAIIQELLDKEPFERFRIRMADGNYYDITNPDLVVTMETQLFVALPQDHFKFLSYVNMTSIEDTARRARTRRNGRRAS